MDSTRHLADCRRGGNHCCHISLVISKAYAMVIAKDTGRTINHNDGRALDDVDVDEATAAQVDDFSKSHTLWLHAGQGVTSRA